MVKKNNSAERLAAVKTLVIKIGSTTLIEAEQFRLRADWLAALAEDARAWIAQGKRLVVVSSGAVALGRGHVPALAKPLADGTVPMEAKQALAAVGQIQLMQAYQAAFAAQGLPVGQVLLTLRDSDHRSGYLNASHTLEQLLDAGVVPVVNENDTVATTEMRVGDNDRLAARVAAMVGADALLLLSDVDGLYTANPASDPAAVHIPEIAQITPDIAAMAGGSASAVGSGGMATKIAAARIAVQAGCHMAILHGMAAHPLARLQAGERCSWFMSGTTPLSARKQWIGGQLQARASVTIDEGAKKALLKGASLLPIGIVAVEGAFLRGEAVRILDPQGRVLGQGLSAYMDEELRRIRGRKSDEIAALLGYAGRAACIHRDDLVLYDH